MRDKTQQIKTGQDKWFGEIIEPGDSRNVKLAVSESYSGATVEIQIHIKRALAEGPTLFVTGALHGDEINGCGAIRQIIQDDDFKLVRGTILLIPVLNFPAFERHSRYLPDRRDLNRSFPGDADGSLASRMAYTIFNKLVTRCNFGIDLHTAALRRTNYPTIRGDLSHPEVMKLATAFGAELVINGKGPQKSFRREATDAGCPTIVMEGGEVWKLEPSIVETAVRGIQNVLVSLQMIDGKKKQPPYQIILEKSKWIRAENGGFLDFHVGPGDIVSKGQAIATNTNLLGDRQGTQLAPYNGVILGMTSLPAVSPGEPICHLGKLPAKYNPSDLEKIRSNEKGLEQRVVDELSSNVLVVDPGE